MNYSIIDFLDIKEEGLSVLDYSVTESLKTIVVEKTLIEHFCPLCSFKLHSKGITTRTVHHPVLQDGYKVDFIVRQRRWKCTNPDCSFIENESFSFVNKSQRFTNLIPYNVCYALKDLNVSVSTIASRFNISDSTVRRYFMQYVDLKRLPLPEILSIDEVYLNIDNDHKYALVMMDFITKEIIDIVISRRQADTQSYFLSIPLEERNKVAYLVCDMYDPYIQYTKRYFRRSKAIIDSFHVLSWLISKLNLYVHQVKKKYQNRDNLALQERNQRTNQAWKTQVDSKEVFALKKFKWVLLKNTKNINYSTQRYYYSIFGSYLDTYDIEKYFLSLDSHFYRLRELKELYVSFNSRNLGKEESAALELRELIVLYKNCDETIFRNFAQLLISHFNEIVHSFKVVVIENSKGEEILTRISNGPMEAFNRYPKDLKRVARGLSNFDFTRQRILWAFRDNAPILAKPKSLNTK